jgi:hypothetical protein
VSYKIELAIRLLSNQATKDEILELLSVREYDQGEIQFLAAASPLLTSEEIEGRASDIDISHWSKHPDEAPSKGWELAGLACNPNLRNDLKERLISQLNPLALVRFSDEIKSNGTISLPLLANPDLREIFEQKWNFKLIVDEARSRTTCEERLFQIYDQDLREYADKSSILGDYVFHEEMRQRLVFSEKQDERITELLVSQPIIKKAAEFIAASESSPEFSYLRSKVLANPNSLGSRSLEIEQNWVDTICAASHWDDLLRESDHPSLFRFLELMEVRGEGYEMRPHSWLALANRISRITSHIELTARIQSVPSDEVLIETVEIDPDSFDGFVEQIMPFLVGANTEFLRESFESESLAIKQAVLFNPHCDADIRALAVAWNDELQNSNNRLHIPNELEMARYSAYSGNYLQIDKWISSSEEFEKLTQKCDTHVAEAISELRLNQSE